MSGSAMLTQTCCGDVPQSYEQMVKAMFDVTKESMETHGGLSSPVLLTLRGGAQGPLHVHMTTVERSTVRPPEVVPSIIQAEKPDAFIWMMEAWFSTQSFAKTDTRKDMEKKLAEITHQLRVEGKSLNQVDPKSLEVLFLVFRSVGGLSWTLRQSFKKTNDGKLVFEDDLWDSRQHPDFRPNPNDTLHGFKMDWNPAGVK